MGVLYCRRIQFSIKINEKDKLVPSQLKPIYDVQNYNDLVKRKTLIPYQTIFLKDILDRYVQPHEERLGREGSLCKLLQNNQDIFNVFKVFIFIQGEPILKSQLQVS